MHTDGVTSKFLYTILKQLDLKAIDWNAVAAQLDITNGHAARMRFSRFKQQMEGVPPTPRRPRQNQAGERVKKAKREKGLKDVEQQQQQPQKDLDADGKTVKAELEQENKSPPAPQVPQEVAIKPELKSEPVVKMEALDDWDEEEVVGAFHGEAAPVRDQLPLPSFAPLVKMEMEDEETYQGSGFGALGEL
ncbi:hypothetical protein MMC20_005815 [Loxospora ochrophaea]|nr:hypothetical protein [Loxospora ochrophaea]